MNDYEKLLQYALRILAKKRYTHHEMQKKLTQFLKRHEIVGAGLIDQVSDRLFELKYLNDENYARDYISDRIRFKPRGKFLLKRELKLKGLDDDIVKNSLYEREIDEVALALCALRKRERQWVDLSEQKRREKAYRFLSSLGFAQDAIYKAINDCYHPHEE